MARSGAWGIAVAVAGLALLPGCPLRVEKIPTVNTPPNTYFQREPPSRIGLGNCVPGQVSGPQLHTHWVTYSNEVSFSWLGTDLDNDVAAYQYQLVETDSLYYETGGLQGTVVRSLDPPSQSGEENWTDRPSLVKLQRQIRRQQPCADHRDSIDAAGAVDASPAISRFEVSFDDIPPVPEIRNSAQQCKKIGNVTQAEFWITATDFSRRGPTPRKYLEYRVQLVGSSACQSHQAPGFTDWQCFRTDDPNDVVIIGTEPPTVYDDLLGGTGCEFTFTVEVRDPAGKLARAECVVAK